MIAETCAHYGTRKSSRCLAPSHPLRVTARSVRLGDDREALCAPWRPEVLGVPGAFAPPPDNSKKRQVG